MKRTFAVVVLLAALGVLLKLALKEGPAAGRTTGPARVEGPASPAAVDPEVELLARYPADADLVRRVYGEYRRNALAIERTDGLRGLKLLDALGVEAVFLYENHPGDFGRLREALTDASAAEILLRWRRVLRPEAGRRHRPEAGDRRDRPALARPEAGRREVPQRPARCC